MKLGGNRQPGDNPLLLSMGGTGSFICPVAYTAGHTRAFDNPVTEHWVESRQFQSPKEEGHRENIMSSHLWIPVVGAKCAL